MSQDLVKRFFTGTGATYDLIVNLFTYGADRYWKRKMLQKIPPGEKILDLACGTGILTFLLAKKFPRSTIVGVDMMPEYIARAQRKKVSMKIANAHLICARAEQVQLKWKFDCITSSYIPKYVPAPSLLSNVARFLKDGGWLVLHDFTYPAGIAYRVAWEMHMQAMKLIGSPLFPRWKTIFRELAGLVRSTRWLDEYTRTLQEFQFREIKIERLTAGSSAIISARR